MRSVLTLVYRESRRYPVAMLTKLIDVALLCTLLIIVGLRPIISESLTSARDPVSAALSEIAAPTPARTIAIDIVALAASALVLLRSLWRKSARENVRSLEWGAALLVIAVGISCFFAGDKRVAVNSAIDWTAALAFTFAQVRLLNCNWRVTLTLGVLAASGMVNVAECVDDRLSAAQTRENYLEHHRRR